MHDIAHAGARWKDWSPDHELKIQPERIGDGLDQADRRVRLATFDLGDISRRDPDPIGERVSRDIEG